MLSVRTPLFVALLGLFLAGCVERRFVITTEPYGAVVYNERDIPMGLSPADQNFTYYGKYRFKIVKDGYQTKIVEERIKAPWYEWPLLDFVSENLVPFTIRDIRRLHYQLDPLTPIPMEKVKSDAEQLRERGRGVGTPLPDVAPVPTPLPGTLPPPNPPGNPPGNPPPGNGPPATAPVPVPSANVPPASGPATLPPPPPFNQPPAPPPPPPGPPPGP